MSTFLSAIASSVLSGPPNHPAPKEVDIFHGQVQANNYIFDFSDAEVTLHLPWLDQGNLINLGYMTLLAHSTHRDQYPVTSFGRTGIKGFTKAKNLVAGSMVFSQMGVFNVAITAYLRWKGAPESAMGFVDVNELPPMDLLITMVNEQGHMAEKMIKSFVIIDSGSGIEVDRPQIGESYSFMAAGVSNWIINQPFNNTVIKNQAGNKAVTHLSGTGTSGTGTSGTGTSGTGTSGTGTSGTGTSGTGTSGTGTSGTGPYLDINSIFN